MNQLCLNEFFCDCTLDISTLEDATITLYRNFGNQLPSNAASYPRRRDTSITPVQKPGLSYENRNFKIKTNSWSWALSGSWQQDGLAVSCDVTPWGVFLWETIEYAADERIWAAAPNFSINTWQRCGGILISAVGGDALGSNFEPYILNKFGCT